MTINMREYMRERYYSLRQEAIDFMGGECVVCGSTKKLEFDHINPKDKEISIAHICSINRKDIYKELEKCQLLCKDCHIEKSIQEGAFDNKSASITCNCGKYFDSIKSYAGHRTWCKE